MLKLLDDDQTIIIPPPSLGPTATKTVFPVSQEGKHQPSDPAAKSETSKSNPLTQACTESARASNHGTPPNHQMSRNARVIHSTVRSRYERTRTHCTVRSPYKRQLIQLNMNICGLHGLECKNCDPYSLVNDSLITRTLCIYGESPKNDRIRASSTASYSRFLTAGLPVEHFASGGTPLVW